jgi:hypothetical protein
LAKKKDKVKKPPFGADAELYPEGSEDRAFEILTRDILGFVVGMGYKVTTPENITEQSSREIFKIDVTIRSEDNTEELTIVECRKRKGKQPRAWVEQAIGRKEALSAKACILVASEGFVRGAENLAKAKGIILRTIATFRREDIVALGRTEEFAWKTIDARLARAVMKVSTGFIDASDIPWLKADLPCFELIHNGQRVTLSELAMPAIHDAIAYFMGDESRRVLLYQSSTRHRDGRPALRLHGPENSWEVWGLELHVVPIRGKIHPPTILHTYEDEEGRLVQRADYDLRSAAGPAVWIRSVKHPESATDDATETTLGASEGQEE